MVVGSHCESQRPGPCAVCVLVSNDHSFEAERHVPLDFGASRCQIQQISVRHYDFNYDLRVVVQQVDCERL